MQYTFSTVSMF